MKDKDHSPALESTFIVLHFLQEKGHLSFLDFSIFVGVHLCKEVVQVGLINRLVRVSCHVIQEFFNFCAVESTGVVSVVGREQVVNLGAVILIEAVELGVVDWVIGLVM